jgi:hypothetical protein
MVDQVQWLLEDEQLYNFDTDVKLERAATYDTEVPLVLFSDSTGADAFPASLAQLLRPSDPEGSGPLWAGGKGCTVLPLAAPSEAVSSLAFSTNTECSSRELPAY